MRKDFKNSEYDQEIPQSQTADKPMTYSVAAVMATCDVIVLQEQNTESQFSLPLSCDYLALPSQFPCIICIVYCATLLKIINHDHPLTIPKD